MPGDVQQFIDYSVNTASDTGENNAASINALQDSQPLDSAHITSGDQSLRQRSEAIRNTFKDSLYLRDADRNLILAGPGLITWPGSTTVAASGIPVISDNLYLMPMLTPGSAQTPPIPPVASVFGTIGLQKTGPAAGIVVTSLRRNYANGDQISIDVASGASFSCTLDAETTYQRTIHIVATGSTTLTTVINALNALTPAGPVGDTTPIVSAALAVGASGSDLLLAPQTKQFMSGNYDGEGHTITPANLAAFFSGNPSSALAEGDALCLQYVMVSDTGSTGGRRQAIPENSNTAVAVGTFFNSRVHPEKLVNAIPICKVVNGYLVFATGVTVPAGAVAVNLGTVSAASVSYAGGPAWADATTNPATTVQLQLSKIVSDLAGSTGTGKVQGSTVSSWLTAGTLAAQLTKLEQLARNPRPLADSDVVPLATYRDFGTRPRSLVDHNGYRMGQVTEINDDWSELRTRTVKISPSAAAFAVGSGTTGAWNTAPAALIFSPSAGGTYDLALAGIPDGSFITGVTVYGGAGDATSTFTATLQNVDTGGTQTTIVANHRTGNSPFVLSLGTSPSAGALPAYYDATTYSLNLQMTVSGSVGGSTDIYQIEIDYISMPLSWALQVSAAGGGNNGFITVSTATDSNLRQRSLALSSGTGINRYAFVRPINYNETLDDNSTYVIEFMLRAVAVDDSAHGAVFRAMVTDDTLDAQAFGIYWDHTLTNWRFQVESNLDLGVADSVTSSADTGVAVTANTTYRVRLEFEGANVAALSSGQAELRCYINGALVASFASVTWSTPDVKPFFETYSNSTGGPYSMNVGRVRRVWNHLLSNDVL
jgi:hypothetical protein